MTSHEVDVVILNFRTPSLTAAAARSALDNGADSILVVDNGSGDDSVTELETDIGDFATILPLASNEGFAAGNNRGAAAGGQPLLLLMNSDVVLRPGALRTMVEVLEQAPRVGIVAPALFGSDGQPQSSAYRFITPAVVVQALLGLDRIAAKLRLKIWGGNTDLRRNGTYTGAVQSLYGPCLLVRRQAFMEVGGFDEAFFLYCEETDLVLRLAKQGWGAYRTAAAEAIHHHNQSAGQQSVRSLILLNESNRLYAHKHLGRIECFTVKMAFTLGLALRWLFSRNGEQRRRYQAALGVWWGWTPGADPRKGNVQP